MTASSLTRSEAGRAVVSISSHVARGSVGNRGAVFAFERTGFAVWSLPTVILPFHPGHGKGTRIVPPADQFLRLTQDLLGSPWTAEIGGILTGYMADIEQVKTVARFVTGLKRANPDLIYLCDPVMGDARGLYVPPELAAAIRDYLLPLADVATPNLFEFAWLADAPVPSDIPEAVLAAQAFALPDLMITSAPAREIGNIGNLLVSKNEVHLAEHQRVAGPSNGSGDLFSAIVLAQMLDGRTAAQAMQRACASVLEVFVFSAQQGSSELMAQQCGESLTDPRTQVTVNRVEPNGP